MRCLQWKLLLKVCNKDEQALLAHPLVREYSVVEKLVPDLLEGSKEFFTSVFLNKQNIKRGFV